MEPLVLFIRRKIADNRDIKTRPRSTTQCTWYKQCLGLGTISFSEHKERIMWINWPDINTSLTPALQMGGPAKVQHTTLYHAGHALHLLRSDLIHFSQNFLIKRTIKSFQKLSNFQKCFDISQSIQRILKRIFLVRISIEELEKNLL